MYYALYDGDYLATGLNATSKEGVKEALLSLMSDDAEVKEIRAYKKMTPDELAAVRGYTIDESETKFSEAYGDNFKKGGSPTRYYVSYYARVGEHGELEASGNFDAEVKAAKRFLSREKKQKDFDDMWYIGVEGSGTDGDKFAIVHITPQYISHIKSIGEKGFSDAGAYAKWLDVAEKALTSGKTETGEFDKHADGGITDSVLHKGDYKRGGDAGQTGLQVENENDLQSVAKYMVKAVKRHRWDFKYLLHYFDEDNNLDWKVRAEIWEEQKLNDNPLLYSNITQKKVENLLKEILDRNHKHAFRKGGKAGWAKDHQYVSQQEHEQRYRSKRVDKRPRFYKKRDDSWFAEGGDTPQLAAAKKEHPMFFKKDFVDPEWQEGQVLKHLNGDYWTVIMKRTSLHLWMHPYLVYRSDASGIFLNPEDGFKVKVMAITEKEVDNYKRYYFVDLKVVAEKGISYYVAGSKELDVNTMPSMDSRYDFFEKYANEAQKKRYNKLSDINAHDEAAAYVDKFFHNCKEEGGLIDFENPVLNRARGGIFSLFGERSKAAINKDRKYLNTREKHEMNYLPERKDVAFYGDGKFNKGGDVSALKAEIAQIDGRLQNAFGKEIQLEHDEYEKLTEQLAEKQRELFEQTGELPSWNYGAGLEYSPAQVLQMLREHALKQHGKTLEKEAEFEMMQTARQYARGYIDLDDIEKIVDDYFGGSEEDFKRGGKAGRAKDRKYLNTREKHEMNYLPQRKNVAFYGDSKFERGGQLTDYKVLSTETGDVLHEFRADNDESAHDKFKVWVKRTEDRSGENLKGEFVLKQPINDDEERTVAEYKSGGIFNWFSGRSKAAINKDRKYLNTREKHEMNYLPERKNVAFYGDKKFTAGGGTSIWGEIRNDFEDDGITNIDAWLTADDDEGGKVIAQVHPDGTVTYNDERAKTDSYAQEMIQEVLDSKKKSGGIFNWFSGRSKSALTNDRRHISQEPHEQAYKPYRKDKRPRYYQTEARKAGRYRAGGAIAITGEDYDFALNVMPPIYISSVDGVPVENGFAVSEAAGSHNGMPTFHIYYRKDGAFYKDHAIIKNAQDKPLTYATYDAATGTRGNKATTVPEEKYERGGVGKPTTRAEKTKKIKAFLAQFPDNARGWIEATDELPDLHNRIAEDVPGYKGNIFESKGGNMPDDVRNTPAKRNQYHKKAILALLPKLNDRDFNAFYEHYEQLFEGYARGGRLKSALMRDRKYISQEEHEQAYKPYRADKRPRYYQKDKSWFGDGGKAKKEVVEFTIPDWAVSYLVNGDASGLNDEDEAKVDKFTKRIVEQYGNSHFYPAPDDEYELGFRASNDIDNLGSNCVKLVLLPSK